MKSFMIFLSLATIMALAFTLSAAQAVQLDKDASTNDSHDLPLPADCCKKQCVNVTTDPLNCGSCGRKCNYSETCCQGVCVNPSSDKKNCGRCYNKCKKGGSCVYGMCSYA